MLRIKLRQPLVILMPVVLMVFACCAHSADTFRLRDSITTVSVAPDYLQYQYGFASDSDFGVALLFYYDSAVENTYANAFSAGWKLSDQFFGWPAKVAFFAGLQKFDEKGLQPDSYGISIYPKVYKKIRLPYTSALIRTGLGIGLSYVSRIPVAEKRDFEPNESKKLVVYIDYSLQLSVAQMLGRKSTDLSANIRDIYIGYSIIHRSTAYGLFAETGGGINYLGLSLEFVLR